MVTKNLHQFFQPPHPSRKLIFDNLIVKANVGIA